MIIPDLLIAIGLALVISALLVRMGGYRNPRRRGRGAAGAGDFVFFFLLIAALLWAGGAWVGPVGPLLLGAAWLPYLAVAILVTLLLVVLLPRGQAEAIEDDAGPPEVAAREADAAASISAGFVVLMLFLLMLTALAYLNTGNETDPPTAVPEAIPFPFPDSQPQPSSEPSPK